jgi:hypothetical protein
LLKRVPDDGNTIDNKGIHHANPFPPACAGGTFFNWRVFRVGHRQSVKGGTLIYFVEEHGSITDDEYFRVL